MKVSFTIPGVLKGKGRHRTRVVQLPGRRPFAQTYTPKETRSAEAMVRYFGREAMGARAPMEGPLSMTITIFKPPSASWSKKRKAASFFVTGRFDLDNIAKMVCDSLNGVTYRDDSQLAFLQISRYYWNGPEQATVEITDELVYPSAIAAPAISEEGLESLLPIEPLPLFKRIRRKRVAA